MKISRDWATPLTTGSFLLMALTGVLMFFHLDSGLNKLAHEWLGWVMVAGVGLHAAANWLGFKRHFTSNRTGQVILVVAVLVTAASFIRLPASAEGGGLPPPVLALRAVAQAPLSSVAPLTGKPAAQLLAELQQAGVPLQSVDQSLEQVAPGNRDLQGQAMRVLFGGAAGGAAPR